jgi:hypothetical protein
MNPDRFAVIESPTFSAQVNVASGYNQFLRGLTSATEVRELLAEVKAEDDVQQVFTRLQEILGNPQDPAYENPYDIAVVAYLWVLRMTNPRLAHDAAERVLAQAGFWWGRKFAEKLVQAQEEKVRSDSA